MKLSKMYMKTLREVPAEAEIPKPYIAPESRDDKKSWHRDIWVYAFWMEVSTQDRRDRPSGNGQGRKSGDTYVGYPGRRSCGRSQGAGLHTVLNCGE